MLDIHTVFNTGKEDLVHHVMGTYKDMTENIHSKQHCKIPQVGKFMQPMCEAAKIYV